MADPELFERMVDDLKGRGMSDGAIDEARAYWATAPNNAPALPCPICYLSGGEGKLIALPEQDGVESLKCRSSSEAPCADRTVGGHA
ncbi:hypothetical protein [Pseudomonas sp.]|uniref:hypothetical protein n=1 Tax=Pseudomonas sp. TaxID=306 RepID=UPI002CBF581A|nr:hypothetical protein [Pseudomonas sp.]HUE92417.1 hypothetical protein [Pseudomonas sp.]